MLSDEEQIRQLVSDWHAASMAGDVDTVLSLMTDDVVFLIPGRPPMSKSEFAAASRFPPGAAAPKMESTCDIREIQIAGEWAFMWTRIEVRVSAPGEADAVHRAGHTLSVLRKVDNKWLLARDANLLTIVDRSDE